MEIRGAVALWGLGHVPVSLSLLGLSTPLFLLFFVCFSLWQRLCLFSLSSSVSASFCLSLSSWISVSLSLSVSVSPLLSQPGPVVPRSPEVPPSPTPTSFPFPGALHLCPLPRFLPALFILQVRVSVSPSTLGGPKLHGDTDFWAFPSLLCLSQLGMGFVGQ